MVEKEKSHFKHFNIQQVPRTENKEADKLVRLTSSNADNVPPGVMVEHLPQLSIETREDKEVNVVSS